MNKKHFYPFVAVLSLIGYAWLVGNVEGLARNSDGVDLCMFKTVTGIPCPSCGTTRSLIALADGNVRQAMLINPFGFLAAVALLVVPLWILVDTIRKKDTLYRFYMEVESFVLHRRWVSISAVLVIAINWIWNISKDL